MSRALAVDITKDSAARRIAPTVSRMSKAKYLYCGVVASSQYLAYTLYSDCAMRSSTGNEAEHEHVLETYARCGSWPVGAR